MKITTKLIFEVTPEIKQAVMDEAHRLRTTQVGLFRRMWEEWLVLKNEGQKKKEE